MGKRIFISYRRSDSSAESRSLFVRLREHFGSGQVFLDVSGIYTGASFADKLTETLSSTGVVIVVIGPTWVTSADASGGSRLQDEHDYVRAEIEHALNLGIPVVPVLVGGASMPTAADVPTSMARVVTYMAATVTHTNFESDIDALIRSLEKIVGRPPVIRRVAGGVQEFGAALSRLPTAVRIFAIVALVALFTQLAFPGALQFLWAQGDAWARVSRSPDSIPLSTQSRRELRAILASIEDQMCATPPALPAENETWGAAQLYSACGASREFFPIFREQVMRHLDNECFCWKFDQRQRVYIYFWVLEAFSKNEQQMDRRVLRRLLRAQDPTGWWPTDLEQAYDIRIAPLYVTAMMSMALRHQLDFVTDADLREDMHRSIRTANAWLAQQQPESADDWADYPNNSRAVRHRLFGGLALAAIAGTGSRSQMELMADRWANGLSFDPASLYLSSDTHPLVAVSGIGDNYRHVPLTWEICGVVSAWPFLSGARRASALINLEERIRAVFLHPRPFGRDWVQADVSYCLRSLEESVGR